MKERAVTMDAEAVRATLAGFKTQMRMPVKADEATLAILAEHSGWRCEGDGVWVDLAPGMLAVPIRIPFHVGDRLRVRETWCPAHPDSYDAGPDVAKGRPLGPMLGCGLRQFAWYAATDPDVERSDGSNRSPWRSPFTMPRWASRLTLEVTEVRLQRLQSITEEDAIAEGVRHWPDIPDPRHYGGRWAYRTPTSTDQCFHGARFAFGNEWNRRYAGANWKLKSGPRPWDRNDWVWAYTFRRVS